ncbi:MAG TPA: DUF58 domain-containing protein [Candidatus Acetothermia bacterium]|nr:DUF58 domain-containing protein [Candidatus Acetothermia bacterium]
MKPEELLPPATMAALAKRRLTFRQLRAGQPGGHPSPRAGLSLEFSDHRPYQPGDDFRQIDWAVYARQRRLVTKVYTQELEAPLYLLLDTSASMDYGRPGKFPLALRLAAALAFVALRGLDRVGLQLFGSELGEGVPPGRGRGHLGRLLTLLGELVPRGETNFLSLISWAEGNHQPGLAVVISDFLAPRGIEEGLTALRRARHWVWALQVLSPQEVQPPWRGLLRLVDVETDRARLLTLGREAVRAYQARLAQHNRRLAQLCSSQGITYRLISSQRRPAEIVLELVARR